MRKLLIAVVSSAVLFSVASCKEEKAEQEKAATSGDTVNTESLQVFDNDMILGKADAPVTIIEYASLSCPHCAEFHSDTFPTIQHRYIDRDKVRFIFRPLPFNESALRASQIIYCADKDKQFAFLKTLFRSQRNWAFSEDFLENLRNIASLGGMSKEKFDSCIADKAIEERILTEKKRATEVLAIKSTPSFYVNKVLIAGNQPLESFEKVIKPILERAGMGGAAESSTSP